MKFLLCLILVGFRLTQAGLPCKICVDLIDGVEKEIEKDESQIDNVGEKVCKKFYNNWIERVVCDEVVNTYISGVEDDIRNKEEPIVICSKINLCCAPAKPTIPNRTEVFLTTKAIEITTEEPITTTEEPSLTTKESMMTTRF